MLRSLLTLLLNSRHVGYNNALYQHASHQHICLNQLQLSCKHICSCGAESAGISVTLASDLQLCPYAHTQPQCCQLYRPFSIPWHLSLHLLDRVLSQSRNHDIMVLSDQAEFGLESGVWIDEYKYQNKDKKHYEKYESVIFP